MKKILFLFMTCVITFSLASCGDNSQNSSNQQDETKDTTSVASVAQQDSASQLAADQERLEREEQERLAQEEQERIRLEKEEQEKKGPTWLNGRFVYSFIDPTSVEIRYQIFVFDRTNRTYYYEEESDYIHTKGGNKDYYVKDGIIYSGGNGIFQLDEANYSLTLISRPKEKYVKI